MQGCSWNLIFSADYYPYDIYSSRSLGKRKFLEVLGKRL